MKQNPTSPIQFKKTTPRLLVAIAVALGCFALSAAPKAFGVVPAPDGCYPGFTTAEGCKALNFLTTGAGNTGVGWYSLFLNSAGNYNTGVGAGTLVLNNADSNTAVGTAALLLNTSGSGNTANGTDALVYNDTGNDNTAVGALALSGNNTSGDQNSAFGSLALGNLMSGSSNTALGGAAGVNLQTGALNVYIGANVFGTSTETGHTYIRNINSTSVSGGGTDTVTVNLTSGLLGHLSSSRRHKEQIKPMANSSEVLYRLKPVTYRYKKEIDATQSLDYGLVAEEVAEIDPNLTARNREGQIESVRYNAINAILLNEFLKEHQKVEEQSLKAQEQETTITQLKKEMETVIARLKEQASQIQKVSVQLELNKHARRTIVENP
jgi:hypothetical protein